MLSSKSKCSHRILSLASHYSQPRPVEQWTRHWWFRSCLLQRLRSRPLQRDSNNPCGTFIRHSLSPAGPANILRNIRNLGEGMLSLGGACSNSFVPVKLPCARPRSPFSLTFALPVVLQLCKQYTTCARPAAAWDPKHKYIIYINKYKRDNREMWKNERKEKR